MKKIFVAIIVCLSFTSAKSQILKKLKDQAEQSFKDKLEQKKTQKVDEKTDKAATTVVNTPDSVFTKSRRKIKDLIKKNKENIKTDSSKNITSTPDSLKTH